MSMAEVADPAVAVIVLLRYSHRACRWVGEGDSGSPLIGPVDSLTPLAILEARYWALLVELVEVVAPQRSESLPSRRLGWAAADHSYQRVAG